MHCLVGMQTGAATVENSMEIPQKKKTQLKMELPFDPAILPLGSYSKKPKTLIHISAPMLPSVHSSTIYNSQMLEAHQ